MSTEEPNGALYDHDVGPLIRHCLYAAYDHAHNARLGDELYKIRWMTKTYSSVMKHSHGATVLAQPGTASSENVYLCSPSTTSNASPQNYDLDAVPLLPRFATE